MKHRPVVCILDNDRERCLREESALDAAIRAKKLPVSGMSNFGPNHLARTGLDSFPAIEVDGVYFTPKNAGLELDYGDLCNFLDMLVRLGIAGSPENDGGVANLPRPQRTTQ
jgi:hypothetical protein